MSLTEIIWPSMRPGNNSSGNTEKQFQNAPFDCNGNPCMPRQFSWTGIACSEGSRIRVVTLNLTNLGLSGSLLNAARLTALTGMGEAFGRQPIHWRDPFVAWKHKGSSRTAIRDDIHSQPCSISPSSIVNPVPSLRHAFPPFTLFELPWHLY
uniref:Leucine-rich repeat-containing N-terminal plant-type domain-containing protein n=1 Tax=Salix viminalis TaxID=40686 RepID=A0A6N2NJM3_SALVM